MASGLPCVAAAGGGPKSLIEDGKSGFLCPPNDAEYYLEKIQLLLNNSMLRKQFIRNGLRYTESLSWDNLAAVYFDDLKRLTGQQPKPKPKAAAVLSELEG